MSPMVLLVDAAGSPEVVTVTATGSAASVPVTACAVAHASGAAFGQLAVASMYGTAAGEAQVPAAPGWGF